MKMMLIQKIQKNFYIKWICLSIEQPGETEMIKFNSDGGQWLKKKVTQIYATSMVESGSLIHNCYTVK